MPPADNVGRLKGIADSLRASEPVVPRGRKANKTLSLLDPQYTVFHMYCKRKGRSASGLVDEFIALILETNADDLSPEERETLKRIRF